MKRALWAVLLLAGAAQSQQTIGRQSVTIPMRDGVPLAADLYNAQSGVRQPVLLVRTPYDKQSLRATAEQYARGGYVVVVEDCRGRYASKGDYTPYNNDRQDGYDTAEWITRQAWSDGHIGMFGGSHTGLVQWLAMADRAPGLTVISPAFTSSSQYRVAYRDRVLRLALISTGGVRANPPADPGDMIAKLDVLHHRLPLLHLPLASLQEAYGWQLPWMTALLAHPEPGGFWEQTSGEEAIPGSTLPVQLVTGYYDFFLHDTVQDYFRLRARPSGVPVQLILGPWTHGGANRTRVQEVDFGPTAKIDLVATNLAWFDRFLKNKPDAAKAQVRYFVLGDNAWREATDWPPRETSNQPLYLAAESTASFARPTSAATPSSFESDPANPVPSAPPARMDISRAALWSPIDYREISARPDVLSFMTAPQQTPLLVAGPIVANLSVESDVPSADWVVRLFAVPRQGLPLPLAQGVFRDANSPANTRHTVKVDMGSTAFHLRPGERLRIEIAGSNFPMYARNLHTGEGPFSARTKKARQKVHLGASDASMISLPVLSGSK